MLNNYLNFSFVFEDKLLSFASSSFFINIILNSFLDVLLILLLIFILKEEILMENDYGVNLVFTWIIPNFKN